MTEKKKEAVKPADNLRFYEAGCEVPSDALKTIRAGRLKGMSDVNPMWRMKRMTEIFGPCGIGWKYTIDRQWARGQSSIKPGSQKPNKSRLQHDTAIPIAGSVQ